MDKSELRIDPIAVEELQRVGVRLCKKMPTGVLTSIPEVVVPELLRLGFKWTGISNGIREMFIADRIESANGEKHLVHFRLMEMAENFGVSFHVDVLGKDHNFSTRYFHHKLTKTQWSFFREGNLLYLRFSDESGKSQANLTLCIGRLE